MALIDGDPQTVRTGEVAGLSLLTPMLDIHTVGAGGQRSLLALIYTLRARSRSPRNG